MKKASAGATRRTQAVSTFRCERSDGMAIADSRIPSNRNRVSPTVESEWLTKLGGMVADQLYPGTGWSISMFGKRHANHY